jgi:hypothetical protein
MYVPLNYPHAVSPATTALDLKVFENVKDGGDWE